MSRSRKDGRAGGGHRNTQGREYWKSRLHRSGEEPGAETKRLTHRKERRAARQSVRASSDAEGDRNG